MKKIAYKKSLPIRKVKLCDFSGVSLNFYSKSLPIRYGVKQENLKELNGALIATETLKKINFDLPVVPQKIITFNKNRDAKLIAICGEELYLIEKNGDNIVINNMQQPINVKAHCEYKLGAEYLLIFATDNGFYCYDGENFEHTVENLNFGVLCNHYYRIFGAEENSSKLYFSDDFNPFNWNVSIDEGGYINLPQEKGNINQLVSFNQSLLVVQEDGLTKITAFSEQDDFVIKPVISPSNIKKNSAVNCGDMVMFVSEKGLFAYNGYDCKNICEELNDFFKNKTIKGAQVGNYCYMLCSDEKNDITDSVIFAYDLTTGKYHFISCGKQKDLLLTRFNDDDFLLAYGEKFFEFLSEEDSNANRVWQSGLVDFAKPAEDKLIKNIEFGGRSIIDLKIAVDGVNYFYNISDNRRQLLNLKGKQFEFEINPKGMNICVPPPYIEYQVLEVN